MLPIVSRPLRSGKIATRRNASFCIGSTSTSTCDGGSFRTSISSVQKSGSFGTFVNCHRCTLAAL